jgi:hypothetical protein
MLRCCKLYSTKLVLHFSYLECQHRPQMLKGRSSQCWHRQELSKEQQIQVGTGIAHIDRSSRMQSSIAWKPTTNSLSAETTKTGIGVFIQLDGEQQQGIFISAISLGQAAASFIVLDIGEIGSQN